eukprot:gene8778-biopygen18902
MGCVTNARKRGGHCSKHSKKDACAAPNCSTPLIPGKGLCVKHGAHGICTAWGCKTNAASGKKGHCAVKDGLCSKHGANGSCTATAAPLQPADRDSLLVGEGSGLAVDDEYILVRQHGDETSDVDSDEYSC